MYGPRRTPPEISPAHLELLRRTGELDRILDGRGLLFPPQGPPPEPPKPFVIPPPDWEWERQQLEAAERAARIEEAQALLERELEQERDVEKPTPPAPKKSRWHR